MPFEKVAPKMDFPAMEREVLAFWERTRAFDRLREINAGKPPWSFLDGPITANNPMGVHHAWGRTYKDLYQRYHACAPWAVTTAANASMANTGRSAANASMASAGRSAANASMASAGRTGWGHELRYQNGFDCQGLWVEVEVEREFGYKSKRDIEQHGIDKFVEACKARACKFAAVQTEQSKRLGQWMDWANSYFTMSDENNYAIWAFLKKCHERGFVYKGVDVMPWCARCGTGLSHMEVSEGYRVVGHTSVFVKFPLRQRKGENLLVWTTTPWTLSSNVAAAVKPDLIYVKVKQGDQFYILGKPHFANPRSQPLEGDEKKNAPPLMALSAMFKNNGDFEIVEEFPGEKLVGLTYDGPFDMLDGAAEARGAHQVIAWEEVTEKEGTGIVHIAPGCGSEDYHLGKALGLPRIAPLLEDGTFRPEFGFLGGKRFDAVADDVVASLKERGLLFAKEKYMHRYPHCWRCKEELVYRLVDEWFISMSWREEIMNAARQARWIPEWGLDRELDWLKNMGDWMISKKRYWGLALPIWECHACGHFEVIGGREELQARAVKGWEEFEGKSPHRPWVDAVKIRCEQCGGEDVSRVRDVGNPWLDASIVSLSTMGYFRDRAYWEKWFPADFVVEALPGQFRNWFYALLTVSTMMTGRSPFKTLKGHGLVLDDNGKPMHKSEGNAIWFDEAAEKFGVDVMRWLYASTPPERNVLFGPKHCDDVRREVIIPWWNMYRFFCDLAAVDGFDPNVHKAKAEERTLLDRWILSDLQELTRVAHEAYAHFDVLRFCNEAKRFIDDLSTWYVRRSRRRFYADGWPTDKRVAYATLYEVLASLNRLVAPILPFLSETMYQQLVFRQSPGCAASVHHTAFPAADASLIDRELSSLVQASLKLVSLGRAARKSADLKIRQPLSELVVATGSAAELKAVEVFKDHLLDELNVKRVTVRESVRDLLRVTAAPNMKFLGAKFGKMTADVKKALETADAKEIALCFDGGRSFLLHVGDTTVTLDPTDVTLARSYGETYAGAEEGGTTVLIHRVVTRELRHEGIARDIIRHVQNLRKESGLDISDRIVLSLRTESADIREAIASQAQTIREETLAVELSDAPPGADAFTARVDLDEGALSIALVKA
ncbi:MAG: isoleucine--tRNA ligase [Phycisphaerae bacterium]|nr:isoleucine--tRNA ligase [Planctomycetia bacterium]MCK6464175.1 isoleucine--tRNA ligase [Phycisphaerae bacterium]MCL4717651.1 isoleucine--tRNA ligase [Phycisphaerae bacterium]NUQ08821.1 isoleucine--tRNA ligase [Phycisphaerae bacterium]